MNIKKLLFRYKNGVLKNKVIKFCSTNEFMDTPIPAKKSIPDWYKKSPLYTDGDTKIFIGSETRKSNKGLKHCIPFIDSMTTGYVATLWQDIQVTRTPKGPVINWSVQPDVLKARDGAGLETMPRPAGHLNTQFVWMSPFIIETPPGYSVLITHPLNRFDLPFVTLSGVHDSDSILTHGHLPFYLKEDFEGIIPAGTPLFQIIPFKREPWVSVEDETLYKQGEKRMWQGMGWSAGFYKSMYWKRKSYE